MPTLISNHNKQVWTTQLKRDINYIQNNFRMIIADEGVDDILNSSVVYTSYSGDSVLYRFAEDKLSEYLKLKEVSDNTKFKSFINSPIVGGSDYSGFYLNDGSCIAFNDKSGSVAYVGGNSDPNYEFDFIFDVNCDRAPNKGGRDRFKISLDNYGKVVFPYYMDKDSILSFCKNQNFDDDSLGGLDDETAAMVIDGTAVYCSYKIIDDGWKMNY